MELFTAILIAIAIAMTTTALVVDHFNRHAFIKVIFGVVVIICPRMFHCILLLSRGRFIVKILPDKFRIWSYKYTNDLGEGCFVEATDYYLGLVIIVVWKRN